MGHESRPGVRFNGAALRDQPALQRPHQNAADRFAGSCTKPSTTSPPAEGLRRFTNKTYGYSITAPAAWSAERENEPDNALLLLRPPSGKAALVIWAGKVNEVTQVGELAAFWEKQARTSLPALSRRIADCNTANWPHLKNKAQLSCRRYRGAVNGANTASAVLYALRGGVGYVLMATYRPGQSSVERMMRQALLSFRYTSSGQAAPRLAAVQKTHSIDQMAQVSPSATLKVMAESPPMELIEESNLFYTNGINGMYPQAAALKAEQDRMAPDAFAAIHAMGERLDFFHNASRDYDKPGNEQFAYWYGLNAADRKYAYPFGLENVLMKSRGALRGIEEALWVVVNHIRLELGRAARRGPRSRRRAISQFSGRLTSSNASDGSTSRSRT